MGFSPHQIEGTGRVFNLFLLADGIQDNKGNANRFVILSKQDHLRTGKDRKLRRFYQFLTVMTASTGCRVILLSGKLI